MTSNDQAINPEPNPSVIDRMRQMVGAGDTTTAPAKPILKFKHIHIIVNPASGQSGINLPALNKLLQELEVEWEMSILRKGGEARELAEKAVAAGVDAIAVYGGDGTVLEVASGMVGSEIPLIILPGGTANVLSVELGIPADQTLAAQLIGSVPNEVRALDMGALVGGNKDGSDLLFFHLGIGLEGTMHEEADRDAKDQSGMLAYVVAALRTLSQPTTARYHITLDGEKVDVEGINCMVTNFGSVGVAGIKLSHAIDMSDGLLDVIVFQDANISSLLTVAANAVASGELGQPLLQWQGREVTIVADPPQSVVVDGELVEVDTITVRVVPSAVRVVVPAAAIA